MHLTSHQRTIIKINGSQNRSTFSCKNPTFFLWVSLVAQMVKSLPAMQEIRVPSLGQEDAQEKDMATPSSVLAWRIPRAEEPGRLSTSESNRTEATYLFLQTTGQWTSLATSSYIHVREFSRAYALYSFLGTPCAHTQMYWVLLNFSGVVLSFDTPASSR